jgi:hypothetical protein
MSKTYSVEVHDGELVSIKIDDMTYNSPDEILDEGDRAEVEWQIELAKDREFYGKKFAADRGPDVVLIMFLIFFSIAILMLGISVFTVINTSHSISEEQTMPGRVIDMVDRVSSDRNVYYYPEVEVSLPDGSTQKIQLLQGSWPPAYDIGDQVIVLYNSERPGSSSIQTSGINVVRYIGSMITGFLGLIFLVVSLLLRPHSKPGTKEEQTVEAVSAA